MAAKYSIFFDVFSNCLLCLSKKLSNLRFFDCLLLHENNRYFSSFSVLQLRQIVHSPTTTQLKFTFHWQNVAWLVPGPLFLAFPNRNMSCRWNTRTASKGLHRFYRFGECSFLQISPISADQAADALNQKLVFISRQTTLTRPLTRQHLPGPHGISQSVFRRRF